MTLVKWLNHGITITCLFEEVHAIYSCVVCHVYLNNELRLKVERAILKGDFAVSCEIKKMARINDPKIAFAYIRPACVLLTREPTVTNIETLGTQLREVDDATLQQLQEYVLFPLRFVLKIPSHKKESVVLAVADTMNYVLENTCVQSWETLRDLVSELCLCLCSPTDPGKPTAETSEELKSAVLRCLGTLLHASYGDIVFRLFEPAMLPGLGAVISMLLALGEQDKFRGIQVAALKCLQVLTLQCDCAQNHVLVTDVETCNIGSTIASFLPGITVALTRVIGGDMRQGHTVTTEAIKVWYKTVGLVMADTQLQSPKLEVKTVPEMGRVGDLVVQRSPDWVRATSGRLTILLKKIISCMCSHRHWRVRLEMVELANSLLRRCSHSLEECVGPLLEALVGSVNDEEPKVRGRCESVLKEISERSQASDGNGNNIGSTHTFTDVLSENLHALATSLPRLMRTMDDKRKLFTLNVFLGYLKVLGPQIAVVLNSAAHLQRLSKALMQVLELDVMDIRIVEERSSATLMETSVVSGSLNSLTKRKHFQYFTDERIFNTLMEICRMLGYYGNVYLLCDHFLDLYRESSAYRKQAAMVLNEIARGTVGIEIATGGYQEVKGLGQSFPNSKEDLISAVVTIVEEYTCLNNWHLATVSEETGTEEQEQSPSRLFSISNGSACSRGKTLQLCPASHGPRTFTVYQLNSNIWQICVQLEGIACFAQALGNEFRNVLMTSLYPVLEKAGDDTLLVSHVALDTMWEISLACGYISLKDLINGNADYLLNDVSLNLQRMSSHPQAPRVLTVMFNHSDPSLLPLVGDIVQDVLLALDLSYHHKAPLFCSVLHSLLKALVRWFPSNHGRCRSKSENASSDQMVNVRNFLLDYRKQRDLAKGIGVEEEFTEDSDITSSMQYDDCVDGPDVKPELPAHLTIAKNVMERCIHLLSHPSLRLRLKVLDVLELCVCLLNEKENELLPMVHCCWPAFLQRLTADDPLAVLRAFKVLCTLGETCGDFLRKRVSKDVLPKLLCSLTKQAPISAKAGPVYIHTLACKLQLAVLQGLGTLCLSLDLNDGDLDAVCEACIPYLSTRQPVKLQEAGLTVLRSLIQVDPDALWFTLNELHCPCSYGPPHSHLQPVQLTGICRPRDEFTDNVLKLLKEEFGSLDINFNGEL